MMQDLSLLQTIAVAALPLLFAITVHEVSHGAVALRLGDPTAQMLGRLTLNPLKHIDPFGTVILPLALLFMANMLNTPPFIFGWAKPVPITWQNLNNPKRDMALVAVAGPASNLIMAVLWALLAKFGFALDDGTSGLSQFLILMGGFGILFNVVLMVLNMLPVPPLDGGRVVTALLPDRISRSFANMESYGFLIILLLLATGLLWKILGPAINFVYTNLHFLFGL